MYIYGALIGITAIPGAVPQQRLRSSMCSTSSPINQEPRETSSFAYLWSMCLESEVILIKTIRLDSDNRMIIHIETNLFTEI